MTSEQGTHFPAKVGSNGPQNTIYNEHFIHPTIPKTSDRHTEALAKELKEFL